MGIFAVIAVVTIITLLNDYEVEIENDGWKIKIKYKKNNLHIMTLIVNAISVSAETIVG